MGELEHSSEHFKWGVERMGCAWSVVQAVGDGVEFGLGMSRQVGALGQVLAQQPVGVLAGAALPGAVWIAEVDLDAGVGAKVLTTSCWTRWGWMLRRGRPAAEPARGTHHCRL